MAKGLTREQIIEYAQRYVSDVGTMDFPLEGDLFCFLERGIETQPAASEKKSQNKKWQFAGYGICLGYALDEDSKPEGKWIWFYFATLLSFPPSRQMLKLQPPHIAQGQFQNADRSADIRIIKVPFEDLADKSISTPEESSIKEEPEKPSHSGKILKFPSK